MANNTELQKDDVVKRMIAADPLAEGETLRVRVFPKSSERTKKVQGSPIPCTISDGKDQVKGFLIENAAMLVEIHEGRPLVLTVESYVSSLANVKDQEALVFITSAGIQSRCLKNRAPSGPMAHAQPQKRIQGGISAGFLSNYLHVLSDDALAGLNSLSAESREQLTRVSNCLAQHSAMTTLHDTISSNPSSSNEQLRIRMQHYMSALTEFQEAQMVRQKASLTSNAGREDSSRSVLIVEQYSKALKEALACDQFFTTEVLCRWHSILCGEGVHGEAGRLRNKAVRVGHVHFRHHKLVRGDLNTICRELRNLELRFRQRMHLPNSRESAGFGAVTLAAIVLFSIIDIHGFCDGNGRLSRIAFNFVLRRFGMPFVIHLFATPSQRSEYTEAIVKTRRNLALVGRGNCSDLDIVRALEEAGAYAPMVELFLDRLSKAITEFEKHVEEKSRLGSEEAELQAAKRVRDRERAGTCLICFDNYPNIATLCCGKAVHLNCVAQWISSNTSCPNCRKQFPALSPRVRAPMNSSEDETAEDDDEMDETDMTTEIEEGSEDETTTADEDHVAQYLELANQVLNSINEANAAMATEDDTTASVAVDDDTSASMADQDETVSENEAADDTTTSEHTPEPDTTTSDNDDDTASAQPRPDLPSICTMQNCHNRSARECENHSCGKCCQLYGRYSCERHNT